MELIKHAMQLELLSIFLKSDASHNLLVEVHPEVFLVSPNRQKIKRADLQLITAENCFTFAEQWKNSKLFDFELLYQEVGMFASVRSFEWVNSPGCNPEGVGTLL